MSGEPILPAAAPIAAPLDPLAEALARDSMLEPPFADGGTAPAGDIAPDKRRRRRQMLLVLLLLLGAALLLFGGWYLLFRKPISELPLPGITVEPVPHYSYSIYGVVAPTGVAVNADGSRIYATQTEGDRQVIAFDASGKQIASLKPPATATGDHVPVYVAVNPVNGDVYVSDRPAATVYIYSADGSYLRAFDPGPDLKGWAPLGLAFDTKGDLFVTSLGAPFQAVHEFGPDGTFIRTFGKTGELSFPNGVAADANGNVYVTDSNNGRLVVYDGDGNQVGLIARGAAVGDLGLPRGAAIDDSGRVYVADVTAQGVEIFHALVAGESHPKFIGRFGEEGSGDGAFRLPNAVAVDGRSRVYVADWRNNRIQVWTY
jgi:DNA-binding beta-propeller fold protein YncE